MILQKESWRGRGFPGYNDDTVLGKCRDFGMNERRTGDYKGNFNSGQGSENCFDAF